MLKILSTFSLSNPIARHFILSIPSTRGTANKAARNMAEYDSVESSDLVNMSKELEIEDRGARHSTRGGRGRGKGSGARGGSGSGRAGGGMNREVAVSKALSKLLRHAAEDVGLTLDGEGFARVDQVVSLYPFALRALILQRSLSIVFSSHA